MLIRETALQCQSTRPRNRAPHIKTTHATLTGGNQTPTYMQRTTTDISHTWERLSNTSFKSQHNNVGDFISFLVSRGQALPNRWKWFWAYFLNTSQLYRYQWAILLQLMSLCAPLKHPTRAFLQPSSHFAQVSFDNWHIFHWLAYVAQAY